MHGDARHSRITRQRSCRLRRFPHNRRLSRRTAARDIPVTRIFYLNLDNPTPFTYQNWDGETVVSACLRKPRGDVKRARCFLSEEGRVEILNSSEHLSEIIDEREDMYGSFRSILEIGRTLFACGYGGQLYKRADDGWQPIDGGMRDQSRMHLDRQFGLGSFANQKRPAFQEQMRLSKETPNFNCVDGSRQPSSRSIPSTTTISGSSATGMSSATTA